MRRPAARHALLLALLLLAGCAYFNALYNARRLYRDAEAASDRGDEDAAAAAYRESLEKAARSLARDPDGRWADDALLLVAQNHFALGSCREADAALRRLLRETEDPDIQARARAYLGAASVCLDENQQAIDLFDLAMPGLETGSAVEAFARLWRARARFEIERPDSAWPDLLSVSARRDALGRAALLEQVGRAIELDRRDLAVAGIHGLLADPAGDIYGDSVRALARSMSARWGGHTAREALEPAPQAPWSGEVRDRVIVDRALQAAAAGDTSLALEELEQAASRSTQQVANTARLAMGRLLLAQANDPAQLESVRAVLLPALAESKVRPIINSIGVVIALLEEAEQGQPLALFAAAEVARDRLDAPAIARRLFLDYAHIAGAGPWSTKAALAALALEPPAGQADSLMARLALANDIYAVASRGSAPAGFEESEERLDQVLEELVARATQATQNRDLEIGDAIAQIDSITAAVRADSVSLACGSLADSLGLAGIRRDSVNAACLREDRALVDSFLRVDTAAWIDSLAVPEQPQLPLDTANP